MIKASLNETMPVYHKLFNNVLNGGSMPLMWCSGLITPIFKSGVRNDPTNYRGISCLGKLFCSVLNQRLVEHVNSLNILHNSQIGFSPNNRTADHVLTLRTLIDKYVHCTSPRKSLQLSTPEEELHNCLGFPENSVRVLSI